MICPECTQDPCVCRSQLEQVLGEPKDVLGWLALGLIGYAGYRLIKGATKKADRP